MSNPRLLAILESAEKAIKQHGDDVSFIVMVALPDKIMRMSGNTEQEMTLIMLAAASLQARQERPE